MKIASLFLLLLSQVACGSLPCPSHTHEIDAGICETDCGFQPDDAGTSVIRDNAESCVFTK